MPEINVEACPPPHGFEDFFRAEYPILLRIANGIVRDTHLAEDVAQEVLIAAQQRFSDPYTSEHARAWVKVATTHAALNAIRGQRRRDARHVREFRLRTTPPGPEEVALASEQDNEVRAVLARLPRHAATVLVLRHSGLSYAEVAEAMEIRLDQVGTMLRRAEAKFRKEIDRATRS